MAVKGDEGNAGAESCGGAEEGEEATGGKGAGTVEEAGGTAVPVGGTGLTVAVIGGKDDGVGEGADGDGVTTVGGASGRSARWPGKSLAKVLNKTSPLSFPGDPATLTIAGRLR